MAKERLVEGIKAEGKDAFIAFFRGKSMYELPELCDALLVIAREMIE